MKGHSPQTKTPIFWKVTQMKNSNRWQQYCETAFNSLRANVHNWGKPEFSRPITRIYYIGVFDCGTPNHTGFISEAAYHNKLVGGKTVHDHYLSPQFVGRMILDNPDTYLQDFDVFRDIFWKSCATVVVTAEENIQLSLLTTNDGNDYTVSVPTDEKYASIGISLYRRPDGEQRWKNAQPATGNGLYFPEHLIQYEKEFLV